MGRVDQFEVGASSCRGALVSRQLGGWVILIAMIQPLSRFLINIHHHGGDLGVAHSRRIHRFEGRGVSRNGPLVCLPRQLLLFLIKLSLRVLKGRIEHCKPFLFRNGSLIWRIDVWVGVGSRVLEGLIYQTNGQTWQTMLLTMMILQLILFRDRRRIWLFLHRVVCQFGFGRTIDSFVFHGLLFLEDWAHIVLRLVRIKADPLRVYCLIIWRIFQSLLIMVTWLWLWCGIRRRYHLLQRLLLLNNDLLDQTTRRQGGRLVINISIFISRWIGDNICTWALIARISVSSALSLLNLPSILLLHHLLHTTYWHCICLLLVNMRRSTQSIFVTFLTQICTISKHLLRKILLWQRFMKLWFWTILSRCDPCLNIYKNRVTVVVELWRLAFCCLILWRRRYKKCILRWVLGLLLELFWQFSSSVPSDKSMRLSF